MWVKGVMAGRRALLAAALCSIAAGAATGGCAGRPAPVGVRIVDHKALMKTVAGHRGKVVVLDCWSTSCPPCVRDFPGLVALAKQYPDVACLSLSFDYEGIGAPQEVLPRVQEFLTGVGAGAIDNMLGKEHSDGLYKKLGLASVPAVYVWGRDGKLARRFDEDDAARRLGRPFTYADVEATVRELRGR
jgi:thiol-disulfide isomerase/thioredoxin